MPKLTGLSADRTAALKLEACVLPGLADPRAVVVAEQGDPPLEFGRRLAFAQIGDFNRKRPDEILLFDLAGDSFYGMLTEISTVEQDGRRFLKLYGAGTRDSGERCDWHLYGRDENSGMYEIVVQELE